MVEVGTMTMFERHLDKYMDRNGLKGIWSKRRQMGQAQVANLVGMGKSGQRTRVLNKSMILWSRFCTFHNRDPHPVDITQSGAQIELLSLRNKCTR